MRRYLVFSIVALFTASLNGVTWADMDEMGAMPPAAPAAALAADSGTEKAAVNDTGTMKDMGAMMGDMSCMMKGMSRVMQHEPMRDETKMKHMSAMMRDMSGMMEGMAGKMGAAGSTSTTMPSDLPGFPGASHIYHVGATGFFLDSSAAIKLTADQQAALNGIKGKSIGDLGAAQRRIDQAEQELWMLTGSDRPDSMTLETKVREIERLKGDQRIAFIRSVGEAARVLTDDQRAALLGTGAPGAAQMTAPQGSAGSVNPQGGMGSTDPKAGMAGMGDDSMGNMGGGNNPNTKGNGGTGDM
jgi:hypothetical protein